MGYGSWVSLVLICFLKVCLFGQQELSQSYPNKYHLINLEPPLNHSSSAIFDNLQGDVKRLVEHHYILEIELGDTNHIYEFGSELFFGELGKLRKRIDYKIRDQKYKATWYSNAKNWSVDSILYYDSNGNVTSFEKRHYFDKESQIMTAVVKGRVGEKPSVYETAVIKKGDSLFAKNAYLTSAYYNLRPLWVHGDDFRKDYGYINGKLEWKTEKFGKTTNRGDSIVYNSRGSELYNLQYNFQLDDSSSLVTLNNYRDGLFIMNSVTNNILNGDTVQKKEVYYYYNDSNHLDSVVTKSSDGVQEKELYTYNTRGEIISEVKPSIKWLYSYSKYDKNGNWIEQLNTVIGARTVYRRVFREIEYY